MSPETATATVAPAAPARPAGLRVATIGAACHALPATVLGTDEIAARLGVEGDWLVSRTGIRSRRVLAEGELLTDLCEAAARGSLARAGLAAADVDLVLVCTITPDQRCPALAPLLADRLGASGAFAMDVGAACTGYLAGLTVAAAQIETGRARTVLLVGADAIRTRLVDPDDRATAGLFGDGAAATVLRAADPDPGGGPAGVGPVLLGADGAGAPHIHAGVDTPLHMDGHETFRTAITRLSDMALQACAAAGVTLQDIDLVVMHQANQRITAAVGRRLGIADDRVVDCIEHVGNLSGGSIPVALSLAADEGRLPDGALVLLAAFGAGFTWGGSVVRWGLPTADPTTALQEPA
ncbi:3-oxoacyl-ACP synthase III family protein [Paraconexibacter algicola]|nr:beta-ketoacyl-ACP synthase 3 [Paraconexibacter algicola]